MLIPGILFLIMLAGCGKTDDSPSPEQLQAIPLGTDSGENSSGLQSDGSGEESQGGQQSETGEKSQDDQPGETKQEAGMPQAAKDTETDFGFDALNDRYF